jgi:Carboxypeptidase regulatory-like domain
MSESRSIRGLWLPALALLLTVGAVVFALTYDWAPPPPLEPQGDRASVADASRGEVAPATGPESGTEAKPKDGETALTPEAVATPVVAAPDGVVAPEGEGFVGILVDANGDPVARAKIKLQRNLQDLVKSDNPSQAISSAFRVNLGGGGSFGFGREAGITDRQGRFAVREPGKDGKYDVSFSHPDHPAHSVPSVQWTAGSRVDMGVVRIPAGGVVFGFVRSEAGKPIAGARVSRSKAAGGRDPATAIRQIAIAVSGDSGEMISFGGGGGELTDAEGYFEMTRVPPGTYKLTAKVKGTAGAVREQVVVAEGGRTGPIRLVTSAGLEISGVVVDEMGQPVAGASVRALRSGSQSSARTNAAGAFKLTGLAPGKVRLMVFGGGRGGWMGGGKPVSQEAEAGSSGVRIVLRKGLTLAGRLVDSTTGAQVTGARVSLVSKVGDTMNRRMTIGMNGSFRFTGLKPGEYSVEVTARGYQQAAEGPHTLVEGRSMEDLVIRMQPK